MLKNLGVRARCVVWMKLHIGWLQKSSDATWSFAGTREQFKLAVSMRGVRCIRIWSPCLASGDKITLLGKTNERGKKGAEKPLRAEVNLIERTFVRNVEQVSASRTTKLLQVSSLTLWWSTDNDLQAGTATEHLVEIDGLFQNPGSNRLVDPCKCHDSSFAHRC